MITEIQDAIIAKLEEISGIIEVSAWVGDIEDILKAPQRMPCLYVVYQGADFNKIYRAEGGLKAEHDMLWMVVVMARNLKSTPEGAKSCYTIIESVRDKLIGFVVSPYADLLPVREDLVFVEKGLLGYGLVYRMKTMT